MQSPVSFRWRPYPILDSNRDQPHKSKSARRRSLHGDMPIIAATRLERDVKNINLLLRQRLQIALSGEILA